MKSKRFLSLLLTMALLLALLPAFTSEADAAAISDVAVFKNRWNGVKISGKYGSECVALFDEYIQSVFGVNWETYGVGNAYQLYDKDYSSLGWTKHAPGNYQVGDIVVWNAWGTKYGDKNNNTSGHVAIVSSVTGGVKIFDQGKDYNAKERAIFYTDSIRGIIRPKFSGIPSLSATININANGGTANTETFTVVKGDQCRLDPSFVSKSGYGLQGWNLYRPADGKWYAYNQGWFTEEEIRQKGFEKQLYIPALSMTLDNAWYTNGQAAQIGSFTFCAVWRNKYSIAIDANGGTANTAPFSVNYGDPCVLHSGYVSRSGYRLKGWNLYRPSDGKWFALNQGWYTQAEISQRGFQTQLYTPELSMTLDDFWLYNASSATTDGFTFVAIWEKSDSADDKPFRFDDVRDEKKYYFGPVYWAYEASPQITNGIDKTHFGPDRGCTRGQVVTFLWRAAGCPVPASTETAFADVGPKAFYAKAVAWAVEKGITKGMSATSFAPDATCTRGQIVTFLWRFKGSPEPTGANTGFTDVDARVFYAKAVAWAVQAKVTNGMTSTTFAPNATCTRGQIVTFLYRTMAE